MSATPSWRLSFPMRTRTMITPQIQLLPVKMPHKLALKSGKSRLQNMLGSRIPEGWPEFPEAFDVLGASTEASDLWPSYFFICPDESALVGNGGFAAPPGKTGEVEIGYEIAPPFRNKGYATAAVRALIELAFSREEVSSVVAHTLACENASNSVLIKVGMTMTAELPNPEVGKMWKWRIRRAPG
jgi:RimJ/RimL family protein N-acetyltransferase